jgi:hypothetical protein
MRNFSFAVKFIIVLLVIFFVAMLVRLGVSIRLTQLNSSPNMSEHFLNRLADNIVFTQDPIRVTNYSRDKREILWSSGYTQTDCRNGAVSYKCNVEVSFTNRQRLLETVLVISDPVKQEYFRIEIIKMSKWDSHVKIKVMEIDKSTIEKDPFPEKRIRENGYYNLEGTMKTDKYALKDAVRIQSHLTIRYESKGEIKTKKIFLNARIE